MIGGKCTLFARGDPGVIRGQCVRQFAKSVSKNFFQKSSLKRDGPVFFSAAPVKVEGIANIFNR